MCLRIWHATTVTRRDSHAHIKSEPMLNPHKIISLLAALLILAPGAAFAQDDGEEEEAPATKSKAKKKVTEVIDEDDCDDDSGCRAAIVFERTSLPPVGSQISVRYNFGDGDPDDFCKSDEEDE